MAQRRTVTAIRFFCNKPLPSPKEINLLRALEANNGHLCYTPRLDEFKSALADGKNSRRRLLRKLMDNGLIRLQNTEIGKYVLTREGRKILQGVRLIEETMQAGERTSNE